MTRDFQLKLKQLLLIIAAWMIVGFFITVYDYLVLYTNDLGRPAETYSFLISAIRNVGAGLIGGLTGGSLLVFYVNVKYLDKPYGYTIFIVSISFVLVVAFITVVMGLTFVPMRTGKPLTDPVTRAALLDFFTDAGPTKALLSWSFIVGVTQLFLQVSYKFGPATFWNIIVGKYQTPKEERRIFMFLDLTSSTAIAEKLGDERYHSLLRDFFADITPSILENKGQIYQYVGDEVVISWKHEDGIENNRCVRCFYDSQLAIQKKKETYLKRYGLVPTFKAGIHGGKVVAGEVGIIKRDITYSGDVLNTTSRVQGMCREFNVELIASDYLTKELSASGIFLARPLGLIKLRGKNKEMGLSEVRFS
jgi:adenylate cyclase